MVYSVIFTVSIFQTASATASPLTAVGARKRFEFYIFYFFHFDFVPSPDTVLRNAINAATAYLLIKTPKNRAAQNYGWFIPNSTCSAVSSSLRLLIYIQLRVFNPIIPTLATFEGDHLQCITYYFGKTYKTFEIQLKT